MSREPFSNEPAKSPGTRWARLLLIAVAVVVIVWSILALSFGAALAINPLPSLLTAVPLAGFGGSINFVLLVALALGVGAIVARWRVGQQDSLLSMLAIAADHGMPLATTARAFADQFGRRYRRRVLQLADRLDRGENLADALDRVHRLASPDARLLVRAGLESGRLGPTLRLAVDAQSEAASLRTSVAAKLLYLLGLLLVIQALGGFCLYFIMPKFEAIFMDFGIDLPEVTTWLIRVGHFFASFFLIIPVLTIILLVWIPFAIASWSGLNVPLLGRFFKRRHATLILRALAPFVEAGLPIERGMDMLASHYPTRWVRRRLGDASRRVQQGLDWRAALVGEGLIREADRDALAAAAVVGNLSWAMNDLAESADRRGRVRIDAWAQTLYPVGVILMGGVVLFMGLGFFYPLIELLRRLSG